MAATPQLLTPFAAAGGITYKNRIGLAPLTRARADAVTGCVKDMHVEYYGERASSGLIFSEGAGISRRGLGWYSAPGIYTAEQVEAWKPVTAAVHKNNGLIFCQLWHMGRAGHSDVFGALPVSASRLPLQAMVTAANHEKKPCEVPHALTADEIAATVRDYAAAATNALSAGFDGIQLHSANGYLIDQFLQSCTNHRTDEYGGSLENRLRLLKEILTAVVAVVPKERVWIRFSPNGSFQEMGAEDNDATFDGAIKLAASFQIGGIEVLDGVGFGFHEKTAVPYSLEKARAAIAAGNPDGTTALAGNAGYTVDAAETAIAEGRADIITFGRPYISNPDLAERVRDNVPLAADPPYAHWWGSDSVEGYLTYPRATVKANA